MILKSFTPDIRGHEGNGSIQSPRDPYHEWNSFRLRIVDWILKIDDLDPSTKHEVGLGALRLLLFDEMDLTHTCCKPGYSRIEPAMDEEEALEVRDEEADMIFQFEALYEKAAVEWGDSSELFYRFLRNFVRENIPRQHHKQGIDPEYAQALREIGVQLQEVSDDEEDSTISSFSNDSGHFDSTIPGDVVEDGSGAHSTLSNSTARMVELQDAEAEDKQSSEPEVLYKNDDHVVARERERDEGEQPPKKRKLCR
jgi:hypothetical protein